MSKLLYSIIDDLLFREEKGRMEYGTTMDRTDLTELEWMQHAYEEALDLVSKTIDAPDAVNTKHHNIKNIEDRSILLAPEYITKAKILNNLKRYDEAFKVLSDNVYKYINLLTI